MLSETKSASGGAKTKMVKWGLVVLLMGLMLTGYGGLCQNDNNTGNSGGDGSGSSGTPPSQVTSPNPANWWNNISITQQLSWAPAGGATSYDVYFGTTTTPPYQYNTTDTSYYPGTLSNSTTYYWRIDSKNSAGTTAGNVWVFTTEAQSDTLPVQVTTPVPSNGISNVSITQWLSWASASGATSYDVYFGTNNPPSNIINGTNTTGASYNPGTLSNSTVYYWRINSRNSLGATTGNVWSFTTEALSGTPPVQVGSPTPSSGLTGVSTTQQLSWASASGATSYDVYFGTSIPGTFIGNQAGTSYNPGTLSNNTLYYWKVDSKNSAGTTPGIVWNFTTAAGVTVPDQVTSPSPGNGSTNRPVNQQISWASANGATSYNVYFGTSSPPSLVSSDQAGTSYDPGTLSNNTTYYWRIDSKNSAGTTSGLVWSFTTIVALPAKVTSPTPSNGSTGRSINQQLSWASAARATSYKVYFGTDSTPDSGEYQDEVTGTSYNPGTLSNYTTYYWRIDSKNVAGTTTGDVWNFRTVAESGTLTFNYTGTIGTPWVVPAGVTSITVDAKGAAGANAGNGGIGGKGGRVQVTLNVTPGETVYTIVGGVGYYGGSGSGYNGGAYGAGAGGGGGGCSYVWTNTSLHTLYAGGGGGGGNNGSGTNYGGAGGAGGVTSGGPGLGFGGGGGTGGGTIGGAGGAGGGGTGSGSNGNGGYQGGGGSGGAGYSTWGGGGGGGGGGYYGGGGGGGGGYSSSSGGGGGGGGGGSSYSTGSPTFTSGYRSGNGQIIITY